MSESKQHSEFYIKLSDLRSTSHELQIRRFLFLNPYKFNIHLLVLKLFNLEFIGIFIQIYLYLWDFIVFSHIDFDDSREFELGEEESYEQGKLYL